MVRMYCNTSSCTVMVVALNTSTLVQIAQAKIMSCQFICTLNSIKCSIILVMYGISLNRLGLQAQIHMKERGNKHAQ